MLTGIIVALPEEISSLTHQKINKGDCVSIDDQTLIALSGTGSKNARKASQLLIAKRAKRLISWGCAAALTTELKPGDFVLPKILLTEKKESLSIVSPWLLHVQKHVTSLSPHTGILIESTHIVSESTSKKTIHQQSGAIALDMESIAIAKTALQYKLPVLVIRCIADPVSMNLPNSISYAQNEQGEIVLIKLLRHLLTHPAELPSLIRLGLHFRAAKNKLKLIAKQLDTITGFEN